MAALNELSFTLNGQPVHLTNVSSSLSLNEWLRTQYGLKGTKRMCGEGGCGCCVVAVTKTDLLTDKPITISVNSCLCPLYTINGWSITTVEGIGSSRKGFHPIQKKVADDNGTQCGYCTPGMVMTMYSLLQQNPKPTKQMVEDNFDGNICRCTGYRPILDAMKSFAVDSEEPELIDIEDVSLLPKCSDCPIKEWINYPLTDTDPVWYSPNNLSEAFDILQHNTSTVTKFVCGNTGKGVFKKEEQAGIYISLATTKDIHFIEVNETHLNIGAGITLNGLIDVLLNNKDKSVSFQSLATHLRKIANVHVRNVGTWAGNLMLTHDNDNFPSDVFTIMEAAGATVTIAHTNGTGEYPLWDFLSLNMNQKIIVSMQIPYCQPNTVFASFKIMPRSQNAHAYVNAAFCMQVDPDSLIVKSVPSFVFGGIKEHAISAPVTESYMIGKSLTDPNTLKGAIQSLSNEIQPNSLPVVASIKYRKDLALNLFYKFYLKCLGSSKVNPLYQSGGVPYVRPVSVGIQTYDSDSSKYPVTQPIPKLTSTLQASGEAEYTTDIPHHTGELAAAFVLTTQGNAKIISMDTTSAMTIKGAVRIITAKDIPQNGQNNFMGDFAGVPEPVFATDTSEYAGQAIAIAIADTSEHAQQMAQAVTIEYESLGKPILTIEEAIAANSFYEKEPGVITIGNADSAIKGSDHVISGEISCGTQYHFTMETQTAFVVPEDDGYTVYSSNQWAYLGQFAVTSILGIPENKVNVIIKRVGGAYGSKISRASQTAAACALASYISQRPVRLHMDLESNMKMVGKRFPYLAKYTVGCTKEGVLNGISLSVYTDAGFSSNDSYLHYALINIDNTYKCSNWSVTSNTCRTHTCGNTYTRAPGYLPGIYIIESIMDDVACSIGMDVEEFKRVNFYNKGDTSIISNPPDGQSLPYCNIKELWQEVSTTADVQNRKNQISAYNKANRWRKRGLSMVPLRYGLEWNGTDCTILVSVFAGDGTVSVVHGGVEIGQGINTKVAQVTASTLGIPLSSVTVVPTNTFTNPNGATTGGSVTSELNCLGALNACQALKKRLDKVKKGLQSSGVATDPSWLQIVQKAKANGIDLSEKYYVFGQNDNSFAYSSYGVTAAEVEIDVLTGETQVLRVDILYDCGQSINPDIDIGQVEGAFIMGLGYWLTERMVYDNDSGQLLTHNTWEYKPPTTKDIPIDFRVELLKNAPNPVGILGSKAVGEPPLCMSSAILYAVKRAIESARHDAGNDQPFILNAPATVEAIQQACLVKTSQFAY